jgi:serine/threonine-protein kinase HipA
MSKNNLINLHCFDREVGRLGFDENRNASFFQYNPDFLAEGIYPKMFPLIFKRIPQTQVFNKYNTETFRGLPPMIADSLPDVFGNIIFKAWMEHANRDFKKISVLEQLAYVGKRGMGALEYLPSKEIKGSATISIDDITQIVQQVLDNKQGTQADTLDSTSLLNIFKIGTSAGGIRPKILVSEHKETGVIIPGDLVFDDSYNHYLIKLGMDEGLNYSREAVEYAHYLTATSLGIDMMPTKLIEGKHFATLRFDRQSGEKVHVLTATGLTGWDHKDPGVSSYENLFELAVHLQVAHKDIEAIFRRMIFNLVFANHDDHLKNHSFIYDKAEDNWKLAPAYDLTYSLNAEIEFKRTSRVLSINGKRTDIDLGDILSIADRFTVKNARSIIQEIQGATPVWLDHAQQLDIRPRIVNSISKEFRVFI